MNKAMAERIATKKVLDEQQRKLQVNLRRCHVEMEKRSKEHAALQSKIEELELYDDSSQREMRGLIKEKQNAMVSHPSVYWYSIDPLFLGGKQYLETASETCPRFTVPNIGQRTRFEASVFAIDNCIEGKLA